MKLYLLAGEASGDTRGAEVMRTLREREPVIEFAGAGGPQMRALAGEAMCDWIEEAGVVGLWDVLKKYGWFRKQFARRLDEIARARPDAVILIDYPGFNLRLARALKKRQPALRIIYYISPQVWAWNRGRIPKMARMLDLMICIFPFEKALYEQSGLKTVFVGHPMLDSLAAKKIDAPREETLVGLLPGSRRREVRKIFPVMIRAAMLMKKARPELRFEAAAASEPAAKTMRSMLAEAGDENFCAIKTHAAHELMQRAAAAMVASGTATMEAAFFRLPFVLIYRVAWLTWFVGRRLVKVDFLGMVNILAGREIVREFLQDDATPTAIADEMLSLLNDRESRETLVRDLDAVIAQLGESGASERAADAILEELNRGLRG
jgi:lipid-A-disaccharide synthase